MKDFVKKPQFHCRVLMVDNFDSFTYNIVQYLGELGAEVVVRRNDAVSIAEIQNLQVGGIILSPGPCTPNEAGISLSVLAHFQNQLPILGVCLGHQAIGQFFGGKVVRAKRIMHGKCSPIQHIGSGVFADLPNGFAATRYHSLVIEQKSLPECLEVTAWCEQDGQFEEIMAVRHKQFDIEGVQFHPESIMSEHGHHLLANFLTRCAPKQ